MIRNRLLRTLCNGKIPKQTCTSVRNHNFDGEVNTKTNMSLITKEDDTQNYIEAYSSYGFRLTSGFNILGPCALFPRAVLHWSVASAEKITPESLSLFCMLYPKLDILIIGKGDFDAKVDKSIIKYLRSNKINVEILPTEQACSTFNFLNAERRVVAAGLIPPLQMESQDLDNITLHDERFPMPEATTRDEFPEVTKTMKSFQTKGIMNTITEIERKRRPRSKGPFGNKEEEDSKHSEKPDGEKER